ncbi:MAG TPA: Crp/Fnr family transcriptional regulator [Solirubrobacteraceae bacterium]|nr:Crp/Fnr family transcriptional regulator [Solirubrobacteraceae bacterium]
MPPQELATDPLTAALRRDGHRRTFARGQTLFVEGDRPERVFMIEQGRVLITCTGPGGKDAVLAMCGPGDVLGEVSVFDGEPRSGTAVTLEQVEAIIAPASALTRAAQEIETAHELIRILASRLREADRRRLEFASLDTLGRVAWRLVELGERFGRETPAGTEVDLPISQEQLASWCAASREATVKALAALRSLGTISTSRRHVLIADPEALRRHAQGFA